MNEFTSITEILMDIIIEIESRRSGTTIKYLCEHFNLTRSSARIMIKEMSKYLKQYTLYIDGLEFNSFLTSSNREFENGFFDEEPIVIKTNRLLLDKSTSKKYNRILSRINASPGDSLEYLFKNSYNSFRRNEAHQDLTIIHLFDSSNLSYSTLPLCKSNACSKEIFYAIGLYYYPITYNIYAYSIDSDKNLIFIPASEIYYAESNNTAPDHFSRKDLEVAQKMIKNIWAPEDTSLASAPISYIIRIKNELNTQKKILHDLSGFNTVQEKSDNGEITVSFTTIPTSSFMPWLLSYGSSITVLKPLKTAREIVDIYTKVIKNNHI